MSRHNHRFQPIGAKARLRLPLDIPFRTPPLPSYFPASIQLDEFLFHFMRQQSTRRTVLRLQAGAVWSTVFRL